MLKRYYSLSEAAEFLSAQRRQRIDKRDVLESAARGEIRLCSWCEGTLARFSDLGPFEDPVESGPLYSFRGYVQIPQRLIAPSGGPVTFDSLVIIEVVQSLHGDESQPPDFDWPEFYGDYQFNFETGEVLHRPFQVNCDDALVPARDLLDVSSNRQDGDKPMTTTERNTLLTIIAALCDYSAIKHQERGAAIQIANMTQEIGAAVTDDTVRKVLAKIPEALETRMK